MSRSNAPSPWAVGALMFAALMGVYVAPVQVGALIDALKLTAGRSGFLGTAELAAMSITAIVVAPLLGRVSSARMVLAGLLLAAAFEGMTSLIVNFPLLLIVRCTTGIGCGLVFGATAAAVSTTSAPDRLMGLGQAIANVLFLLLFLALPSVVTSYGSRGLFIVLGIAIALTLIAARSLRRQPRHAKSHVDGTRRSKSVVVSLYCFGVVLLNVGLGALWGFVERIGLHVGLTSQQVGLALSACTVAMIGGSLVAGWIANRWGRTSPVIIGTLACGIGAYITANAGSAPVYIVALLFYGFAYLFLGPYLIVGLPSQLDTSGRLAAVAGGTMWLSYSVGLTVGGLISDRTSLTMIGVFALATSTAAAAVFVFVVSTKALGRRVVTSGGNLQ